MTNKCPAGFKKDNGLCIKRIKGWNRIHEQENDAVKRWYEKGDMIASVVEGYRNDLNLRITASGLDGIEIEGFGEKSDKEIIDIAERQIAKARGKPIKKKKCPIGHEWSVYRQECRPSLGKQQADQRGGNKCKSLTEKKDGLYCNDFPKDLYYVIRWLDDGGYHYYPRSDGYMPKGFKTKEIAKLSAKSVGGKVVTGTQARKYPIPKRW